MSNFLVLMSDEHNPMYSAPYGCESVITPNMQQLADRGILFESAYCPSPLCLPSRSSFMCGRRVHEIQTYSNCIANLDTTHLSYGAALAQQGVHSAHIGKVDVYAPGKDLAFSEMILPWDRKSFGDDRHRRNPMSVREGARERANGFGPKGDAADRDLLRVDKAVKWIRESAPKTNRPWVLTVNLTNPHFPHFATPELWKMYEGAEDLPEFGINCETAQHPYAKAVRRHFETEMFSEKQARGLRRGYMACITFVDRQLGRLIDAMKEAGVYDATNVAYTSDHGDMLGKFGMWWKCSLYEDSVRVPMIVAGPDFNEGRRVATPVDVHDLRAGFFEATGTHQPAEWLGEPLQSILLNDENRVVFSEYHGHGATGSSYMIRKGKWKYIRYTRAPDQLFDLKEDQDELTNLAETETDIAADFEAELRNICSPEAEHERAERFIENQLNTIANS